MYDRCAYTCRTRDDQHKFCAYFALPYIDERVQHHCLFRHMFKDTWAHALLAKLKKFIKGHVGGASRGRGDGHGPASVPHLMHMLYDAERPSTSGGGGGEGSGGDGASGGTSGSGGPVSVIADLDAADGTVSGNGAAIIQHLRQRVQDGEEQMAAKQRQLQQRLEHVLENFRQVVGLCREMMERIKRVDDHPATANYVSGLELELEKYQDVARYIYVDDFNNNVGSPNNRGGGQGPGGARPPVGAGRGGRQHEDYNAGQQQYQQQQLGNAANFYHDGGGPGGGGGGGGGGPAGGDSQQQGHGWQGGYDERGEESSIMHADSRNDDIDGGVLPPPLNVERLVRDLLRPSKAAMRQQPSLKGLPVSMFQTILLLAIRNRLLGQPQDVYYAVLHGYTAGDVLNLRGQYGNLNVLTFARELKGRDHELVKEYAIRFINVLVDSCEGRKYIVNSGNEEFWDSLFHLYFEEDATSPVWRFAMEVIQKMSLRRGCTMRFVEAGVAERLVDVLEEETMTPHNRQYAAAMLLNLTLPRAGQVRCEGFLERFLTVLLRVHYICKSKAAPQNPLTEYYINGVLYNMFMRKSVRNVAIELEIDKRLEELYTGEAEADVGLDHVLGRLLSEEEEADPDEAEDEIDNDDEDDKDEVHGPNWRSGRDVDDDDEQVDEYNDMVGQLLNAGYLQDDLGAVYREVEAVREAGKSRPGTAAGDEAGPQSGARGYQRPQTPSSTWQQQDAPLVDVGMHVDATPPAERAEQAPQMRQQQQVQQRPEDAVPYYTDDRPLPRGTGEYNLEDPDLNPFGNRLGAVNRSGAPTKRRVQAAPAPVSASGTTNAVDGAPPGVSGRLGGTGPGGLDRPSYVEDTYVDDESVVAPGPASAHHSAKRGEVAPVSGRDVQSEDAESMGYDEERDSQGYDEEGEEEEQEEESVSEEGSGVSDGEGDSEMDISDGDEPKPFINTARAQHLQQEGPREVFRARDKIPR